MKHINHGRDESSYSKIIIEMKICHAQPIFSLLGRRHIYEYFVENLYRIIANACVDVRKGDPTIRSSDECYSCRSNVSPNKFILYIKFCI